MAVSPAADPTGIAWLEFYIEFYNIEEKIMFGFDTEYFINNKSLRWIEPVIVQWLKVHRDYLEEFYFEDSLYWYNERANISALAGAVWRCSGFAVEEYSAKKGCNEEESSGRIDLYFCLGENEAVVEAKLLWLNFQSVQECDFYERIEKKHSEAMEDIRRTMMQNPADQGLGLTFILPYWRYEERQEQKLKELKRLVLESEHDVCVWWHNKTGKSLVSERGRVFDSIAMIADLL